MKKPTIVDVAKMSGSSISSVSRYLADKTSIKPLPSRKIAEAIEKLNYVPNNFARNLGNGNSNIVGFVQPDISQDLFNQCMKAMNLNFYQNDYMLITCDTNNNPDKERNLINSLIRQNVLAIIVITCGENTSFLNEIASSYKQLIIANRPENTISANSFCEDQVMSGYRLAKYMIEQGNKSFRILGGVPYSGASKNRLLGFQKAFDEFGIKFDKTQARANCIDFDSSYSITENLLKNDNEFDCILFTNQRSADGIVRCLDGWNKVNSHNIKIAGFTSKANL
ncbi:MAG: LacI family DNA-binding transcriptional regulator, partial [Clostridia bacterium]